MASLIGGLVAVGFMAAFIYLGFLIGLLIVVGTIILIIGATT